MLRIKREQFTYRFAVDVPPVARVRTGDRLVFETYDASTGRIGEAGDVDTYLKVRDPRRVNPAAGPVWVEGARPGDDLIVTIEAIVLANQGYLRAAPEAIVGDIAGPVAVIVPVIDGATLILPGGLHRAARPMVGVIGTAPTTGEVLTAVPGPQGSNLDCNLVRVGARVHLPVLTEGALLALGDVHAAMGDAEVSGTGVEINAEVTALVEVAAGAGRSRPWIEVDGLIAATGSAPTLEAAVSLAVDGLLGLLTERLHISRTEAFMLVSAYGDVRIGQACAPGTLDATAYACFALADSPDSMTSTRLGA